MLNLQSERETYLRRTWLPKNARGGEDFSTGASSEGLRTERKVTIKVSLIWSGLHFTTASEVNIRKKRTESKSLKGQGLNL